jgi:hypothetical protein
MTSVRTGSARPGGLCPRTLRELKNHGMTPKKCPVVPPVPVNLPYSLDGGGTVKTVKKVNDIEVQNGLSEV